MSRFLFRQAILLLVIFIASGFFIALKPVRVFFVLIATANQRAASTPKLKADNVIDEAPEPTDPTEQAQRVAKNRRYNRDDRDLLSLDPDIEISVMGCGALMPLLPTSSTPVIVIGTVTGLQPYLSENHTFVYTEFLIHVEEVLKTDGGILPMAGGDLVIDRGGGILRLRSGRVIRYHISGTNMARPLHTKERCLLFLNRVNNDADLHLAKGFLLHGGKAFLMGEQVGSNETLVGTLEGVEGELSKEGKFLETVRQAIANPPSTKFYSELDMRRNGDEK